MIPTSYDAALAFIAAGQPAVIVPAHDEDGEPFVKVLYVRQRLSVGALSYALHPSPAVRLGFMIGMSVQLRETMRA